MAEAYPGSPRVPDCPALSCPSLSRFIPACIVPVCPVLPLCSVLSRFVPLCPCLSRFVPACPALSRSVLPAFSRLVPVCLALSRSVLLCPGLSCPLCSGWSSERRRGLPLCGALHEASSPYPTRPRRLTEPRFRALGFRVYAPEKLEIRSD